MKSMAYMSTQASSILYRLQWEASQWLMAPWKGLWLSQKINV